MTSNSAILITGAGGFLGASLTEKLMHRHPDARIILTDVSESERLGSIKDRAKVVIANLSDPKACESLVTADVTTVFHFASLVSGGAEKDFEAGMSANVYATLNVLEACRRRGRCPRFLFTSSIATFGGSSMPDTVDDWTHQHPQNSYGVAKVIGEQLLNDYSRKGFIDGRGVRLAAIVVRDEPNSAASGYASSIVREPIHGKDYVCPVRRETRLPILSLARCIETMLVLSELPSEALGDYRTINSPSISPAAEEIADAVASSGVPGTGKIIFQPDPEVEAIVESWPKSFTAPRAEALGLRPDPSIEHVVRDYAHSARKK